MNISPELLEKVQKENKEFRGLYENHTSLKKRPEPIGSGQFEQGGFTSGRRRSSDP